MAALAFPTIDEKDKEAFEALKYIGIECDNVHEYNSAMLYQQDLYIIGANAVLEMIETYIQNLDLGNSAKEKFYKLDVISDIGLYIKELKGE